MKQDGNTKTYEPDKAEGLCAAKGVILGVALGALMYALGGLTVYMLFIR